MTEKLPEIMGGLLELMRHVAEAPPRKVKVTVDKSTFEVSYKELSDSEALRVPSIVKTYASNNLKTIEAADLATFENQFTVCEMLRKANPTQTIDDFLKLPPNVIDALSVAIQEDVVAQYPHVQNRVERLLGRMGKTEEIKKPEAVPE